MKIFKRLLFVILFVPVGFINAIYDIVMFAKEGEDHDFCMLMEWMSEKLLD